MRRLGRFGLGRADGGIGAHGVDNAVGRKQVAEGVRKLLAVGGEDAGARAGVVDPDDAGVRISRFAGEVEADAPPVRSFANRDSTIESGAD